MSRDAMQGGGAAPSYRAEVDMHDVPLGYKRTEVGMVPACWKVVGIPETLTNIIDYRGRTPRKLGMEWGGDIPALSARNVRMGRIDLEQETYYGSDKLYRRWMTNGDARRGDIAFTMEAPLGNVATIPDDRRYILSQRTILLQPDSSVVDSQFLFFVLGSNPFQQRVQENATGSTATGVQRSKFEKLSLALPSLDEQRAIAEALSAVDGVLGALEALIAKKRAIKQAVMQQLFTRKTRLPEFSGEWETKRLGEVAEIKNGATPSTHIAANWNGDISWCTPTDITRVPGKYLESTERRITRDGLVSCAASLLPPGALLLCSRATVGEVKIARTHICTNQGFKSLVCKAGTSNEYLYYLLLTLKPRLIERASGSTFLEIGKRDVASLQVLLPCQREQTAIVSALSDMDAEIAVLDARCDKTRAIKQGMMQQLLTGRVRLQKSETADTPAC